MFIIDCGYGGCGCVIYVLLQREMIKVINSLELLNEFTCLF